MPQLLHVSLNATLQLVLCALVGVLLARKGLFTRDARRSLAKVIMWAMLPALLITSLGHEASPETVRQYLGVMLAVPVLVLCGFLAGRLLTFLFRIPADLRPLVTAASTFGNASYVPLPFLAAICATTAFTGLTAEQATARSVTYVSLYLMCYSPTLWCVGFPYLSGKRLRDLRLSQIVNPPLMGSAIGITIAFIPPLHDAFFGDGAPLAVVIDTLQLLAKGVFPCALLLLGANLCGATQPAAGGDALSAERCPLTCYLSVIAGKLLIMPLFGLAYTALAWKSGLIPHDPILALVILVESAVPPANNLIIMCQTHGRGELPMSRMLFAAYCASIATLTLWTMLFLKLVMSLD
ncbi:MAG: AEC family transporter [Oligosphaeraceae bacterium]